MLLNQAEATAIVKREIPDGRIEAVVSYRELFLFQVFTSDPDEGHFDPYYSVNKRTGQFQDFSIFQDGNMTEILDLFLQKKGQT